MPSALTVDLSLLVDADAVIHVADIELPPRVTLVTDPDTLVARIIFRRMAEEAVAAPIEAGEEAAAAEPERGAERPAPSGEGEAPAAT